ncbi:O-antigen translocase [Chryseobacterium chendengshani]|uniref:O-antigen translocase n=1 Tax=Chryseobacterium sp. LJ756 TaxID=2864113 RepID=UPI001C6433BD|nr:O-antigen translocase [Chryseobacterium sp. LJ756]MBW7676614.1 O-antigen translocase [Chryseobacterium sp. LJ756]
MSKSTGYRTALKSTSIFGGVQVIRIVINLVRFKLVAILLGPFGFGIISMYNTIITFVQSLSSLGLANSAVRDISVIGSEKPDKRNLVVSAIYKWFVATGVIGMVVMIGLSSIICKISFDNYEYTVPIMLLSVCVLFQTINNGDLAVIQGFRDLKSLAKVNIAGSLIGLIVSIPFFYFFAEKGIIPSLILSSLVMVIFSNFFLRKLDFTFEKQSLREIYKLGKSTARLGIMLSISAIAVSLVEFIVKAFITRYSSTEIVGLYQAGWTINASYVGVVLTAMGTDYFPRLSEASGNGHETRSIVTEQTEIALIILAPIICIMITFLPFIIQILYTKDFLSIVPMTRIMLLGSFFKASSWAISYMFLAKGDGKRFLMNELVINLISLLSMIILFYYFSLEGIGLAFTLNYLIYFIMVYLVAKKKYNFTYTVSFWKLLGKYSAIAMIIFTIFEIFDYNLYTYIAGCFVSVFMMIVVYHDLNSRMNISSIIQKILKK